MFRRKKSDEPTLEQSETDATTDEQSEAGAGAPVAQAQPGGPWDSADAPDPERPRLDLGSLRLAPPPGFELRVQVNEETQQVQSVLLAGPDGALELRAFAAARNDDMWDQVRPDLVADVARRGGRSTEQQGTFGPELVCQLNGQDTNGKQMRQDSRILGINGDRWFLRATFLGAPALQPSDQWDDLLRDVVVHRGDQAMAPGDALPLALPAEVVEAAQQQQQQS